MKKLFFAVVAVFMLAACSNNEAVEESADTTPIEIEAVEEVAEEPAVDGLINLDEVEEVVENTETELQ